MNSLNSLCSPYLSTTTVLRRNLPFQNRHYYFSMTGTDFIKLVGSVQWPKPEGDNGGRILTKQFLEASKVILKFLDHLGKPYILVKKDVEGNIRKLGMRHSEDPKKFAYLQDMIEYEVYTIGEKRDAVGSLLWLKRALHFICLFLHALVLDHENNVREDSLLENMKISYEVTLKPYHNVVLQKLFVVLSRIAPTRKQLLRSMSVNNCPEEDEPTGGQEDVIQNVKLFTLGLQTNLELIFDLYVRLELDKEQFQGLPTPTSNESS